MGKKRVLVSHTVGKNRSGQPYVAIYLLERLAMVVFSKRMLCRFLELLGEDRANEFGVLLTGQVVKMMNHLPATIETTKEPRLLFAQGVVNCGVLLGEDNYPLGRCRDLGEAADLFGRATNEGHLDPHRADELWEELLRSDLPEDLKQCHIDQAMVLAEFLPCGLFAISVEDLQMFAPAELPPLTQADLN